MESFSWNYTRTGASVVVDRGRGSTTTNHEDLVMMRVSCDTKCAREDFAVPFV